MKTFTINAGTIYSDNQMTDRNFATEAIGQVTLEDDEVQQLTTLIKTQNGETDAEALGLKERYPSIYQKLKAAYCRTVGLAEYKVNVLMGLYLDVSFITDDQIDQCMTELGYEEQSSSFDRFIAHVESLSLEDFDQFMIHHFKIPYVDHSVDSYKVEIPQGLLSLI